MRKLLPSLAVSIVLAAAAAIPVDAQKVVLTPFQPSGIYRLGARVGWTVTLPPGATAPAGGYTYRLLQNEMVPIKSGTLDLAAGGSATIDTTLDVPAMIFLEVTPANAPKERSIAGAAVAPREIQPEVARPADFDTFWTEKLAQLRAVPVDPVITPDASGVAGVDYATFRLNNVFGAHVYGQLAKPARPGKFPALVILQWASPPYPLQKPWVTDHAAAGWLTLNVEPHDVPSNLPPAFYAALPQMLKSYNTIYNDERDRNYFLQMYLGDCRALEYLKTRPDWDGKTLVLMGTSMGGQQSLCVAGLDPQVTDVIVDEPAGCDALAALHGRFASYPNWDVSNPKVVATAPYFDPVNFAPRIRARCLVAMGFVDETAAPAGVWTAFNLIPGPKEAAPMVDSPHNNLATAAQQRPYTDRSAAWLAALVRGEVPPAP
jgi:cephalosporin-C deacetylase